jgi:colicin import membrane protein
MVFRTLRLATLAVAAGGLSACSMSLLPDNVTPVVPQSTSVQQANAKLEQVAMARAAIESTYAASEQVCYAKFFVNNCLDTAKEKRRSALAIEAAIEDEAQFYKRKSAVDERDREVGKAIKDFEADEARAAAQPAPPPREELKSRPVAPKATLSARRASRDEKAARRAAQAEADAPKRAAKAKAFEQRKLESEKRQREVAEKLAEKAAKGKP